MLTDQTGANNECLHRTKFKKGYWNCWNSADAAGIIIFIRYISNSGILALYSPLDANHFQKRAGHTEQFVKGPELKFHLDVWQAAAISLAQDVQVDRYCMNDLNQAFVWKENMGNGNEMNPQSIFLKSFVLEKRKHTHRIGTKCNRFMRNTWILNSKMIFTSLCICYMKIWNVCQPHTKADR